MLQTTHPNLCQIIYHAIIHCFRHLATNRDLSSVVYIENVGFGLQIGQFQVKVKHALFFTLMSDSPTESWHQSIEWQIRLLYIFMYPPTLYFLERRLKRVLKSKDESFVFWNLIAFGNFVSKTLQNFNFLIQLFNRNYRITVSYIKL